MCSHRVSEATESDAPAKTLAVALAAVITMGTKNGRLSNGNSSSGVAIRGLIKSMIEAERTSRPLSDSDITRELNQQGLLVARRTVAKYRQMLKIEAVDRRQPAHA